MPKRRKKLREDFIFAAIFLIVLTSALIIDWWEDNAVIGWVIIGVASVLFLFLLFRFAGLRSWFGTKAKETGEKIVYDDSTLEREPLPWHIKKRVLARSSYRCENQNCSLREKLHIHHIDMDRDNNDLWNLIALCPKCHRKAHNGYFSEIQLRNWVKRDWGRHKLNRQRG